MPHPAQQRDPHEVARRVGEFWRDELPAAIKMNRDVALLIDRGLAELATTNLWGSANREPSQLMWHAAGDVLRHGWLQLRAREKPRGYAGDHEMLGAIYEERVTADPLGIAFDQFFLRQAAPQAVRNRMDLVRNQIAIRAGENQRGKDEKVVVIGSGAGLEIAAALKRMPAEERQGCEFWLLDLDPAAVALAEENLQPLLPAEKLHCLAENLARLPKKQRAFEPLQNASLIICTGFFDYLENAAAGDMLTMFWQILQPGGEAMVFNFAPWNPTRAYMEWIGNWYLLYRTREDLAQLARSAGIAPDQFEITAEATGVDLLLRAQKPQ